MIVSGLFVAISMCCKRLSPRLFIANASRTQAPVRRDRRARFRVAWPAALDARAGEDPPPYRVARRLGQRIWRDVPGAGSRAVAAGNAAVLALHPLATEAVTYLSGRSVALATASALAARLMHMAGARAVTASTRLAWRGGAVLCCIAAVSTREAMFVAPAVLLLWEWARADQGTVPFRAQSLLAALRRTLGYWLLALGAVIWLLLNDGYANLVGRSRLIVQGRIAEPTLLPALEYFVARLLLLAPLSIDPELRAHDLGLLHRLALGAALFALLAFAWRPRTGARLSLGAGEPRARGDQAPERRSRRRA